MKRLGIRDRRRDQRHLHREDAEFLQRAAVLPEGRVVGVETGGCPHTAIRDDVSMNLEALEREIPDLDLIFVESSGDNLAASFSPELVNASIYVVDVAGGEKVPRKGGPGVGTWVGSLDTFSLCHGNSFHCSLLVVGGTRGAQRRVQPTTVVKGLQVLEDRRPRRILRRPRLPMYQLHLQGRDE